MFRRCECPECCGAAHPYAFAASAEGVKTLTSEMPDTITSWVGSAICTNSKVSVATVVCRLACPTPGLLWQRQSPMTMENSTWAVLCCTWLNYMRK